MIITKMQATGNDFLLIDNSEVGLSPGEKASMARRLCKRRLSFGADGMIFLEKKSDLYMDFYNSDGSLAEMCGNGARSFARFAYELGYSGEEIIFESLAGRVVARRLDKQNYSTEMPAVSSYELIEIDGQELAYVEIGNPGLPHLVVKVDEIIEDKLLERAIYLRHHERLAKGANVNFYTKGRIKQVLTFERGVEAFTLACGTGVSSVYYHLNKKKEALGKEGFLTGGGRLFVEMGERGHLILEGPVTKVYECELVEE